MTERLSARRRRERIETVARETARVLHETGCFRLRVGEVARVAGVGKGTVYLDHRDKASLVGASLAIACRDLTAELSRQTDAVSVPPARLVTAVRVLSRAFVDRPDLAVLLERRLVCSARWIGADVGPYTELVEHLRSLVGDALVAGGGEPALDPELAAQAILGTLSMPAWSQAAERAPEDAVRAMIALIPGLFGDGDQAAGLRDDSRVPEGPG